MGHLTLHCIAHLLYDYMTLAPVTLESTTHQEFKGTAVLQYKIPFHSLIAESEAGVANKPSYINNENGLLVSLFLMTHMTVVYG